MAQNALPVLAQPAWLREIVRNRNAEKLPAPDAILDRSFDRDVRGQLPEIAFPVCDVLRDSLYYPASGLNGTPLKFLVGNVYSFIYTDINITKDELRHDLAACPPRGYDLIYARAVTVEEIAPSTFVPLPFELTCEERKTLEKLQRGVEPFGHWSIWKAQDSGLAFSLFFLRGEICAVFQGLYVQHGAKPKYLAIIQPGHADGVLAWERIEDDNSHFHRLVMDNPAGPPDYLISGNACDCPTTPQATFWREYEEAYTAFLPERCAAVSRLKAANASR